MANETLQNPFLPEDENQRAYDASDLMLGGAGLGGAAFAAQTGRAPTPVPPKTPPVPFPSGKNVPTNPLSPATGPSGGTKLPPQPSLAQSRAATRATLNRAAPSLLGRAGTLLGPAATSFLGGYTIGSVLDKAFDISGNVAEAFIPNAPTLTREERAALGQPEVDLLGSDNQSETPVQTEGSMIGQGTVLQEPDNDAIINEVMSQAGVPRLGDKIIDAVNSMQQNQVIDPVAAQQALEEYTGPVDSFFPTEAQQAEYKSTTGPMTTSQYLGSRMGSQEASRQASPTETPMSGQTLSQFMRYEDQPEQRTEQFVDPQGRLRRRMTPTAAALAGLPSGVQPLSPEYTPFEQAGAMREARLAAQPDFGRAISDRERRGGQLSQADLRDLVQAERPGATVGEQARALEIQQRAGMGEFETKSPEEEELERQSKQARIDFMKAQIAQMEKEPTEAEKQAADVELRLKEQQLRQGGFEPVGVETDPDTGISVQLYRNPQTGEEQRVYKTASGTPVSDDDLQSLFGDSAKVNEEQTSIPTITSQEEYDNLEKGARYRDSQGRLATKKS